MSRTPQRRPKTPQREFEQSSEVVQNQRLRIPEGEYEAMFVKGEYKTGPNGQPKAYFTFRFIDGLEEGPELFMACTCPRHLKPTHKLYTQWALALGRNPTKKERFSFTPFTGRLFKVQVRDTQRKHRKGQLLPDFMQYSVIDSILEPLTGPASPPAGQMQAPRQVKAQQRPTSETTQGEEGGISISP